MTAPGFDDAARATIRSCRSCSATPRSRPDSRDALLERGIYVVGFSYPVVPQGAARIRTQMSAAHSADDIDRAIAAFEAVRTAVPAT